MTRSPLEDTPPGEMQPDTGNLPTEIEGTVAPLHTIPIHLSEVGVTPPLSQMEKMRSVPNLYHQEILGQPMVPWGDPRVRFDKANAHVAFDVWVSRPERPKDRFAMDISRDARHARDQRPEGSPLLFGFSSWCYAQRLVGSNDKMTFIDGGSILIIGDHDSALDPVIRPGDSVIFFDDRHAPAEEVEKIHKRTVANVIEQEDSAPMFGAKGSLGKPQGRDIISPRTVPEELPMLVCCVRRLSLASSEHRWAKSYFWAYTVLAPAWENDGIKYAPAFKELAL